MSRPPDDADRLARTLNTATREHGVETVHEALRAGLDALDRPAGGAPPGPTPANAVQARAEAQRVRHLALRRVEHLLNQEGDLDADRIGEVRTLLQGAIEAIAPVSEDVADGLRGFLERLEELADEAREEEAQGDDDAENRRRGGSYIERHPHTPRVSDAIKKAREEES